MLPILALTTGDPAGIGPEVVCRALFSPEVQAVCRPLVIGDGAVLRRAAAVCGLSIDVRDVVEAGAAEDPGDAGDPDRPLSVAVLDPLALAGAWEGPALTDLPLGAVSAAAGRASVAYVLRAIDLALAGEVAGIVTGPINKEAMNLAGYRYAGHTELLAERTGTREAAMMLVTGNAQGTLRVVHVTTHVALERVPLLVTPERLATVFELAEETMRRLGIAAPRIAVAGLNPHAGEHGLFGSQDADVIAPAVALARQRGWGFSGPWPPDTVFARAHRGQFDAVVAMYHDQGHIAIKMIGFDEGVNVSLGMPIVRTSVDHGTAFDIAGKGIASPVSMIQSIVLAARLARDSGRPYRIGRAGRSGCAQRSVTPEGRARIGAEAESMDTAVAQGAPDVAARLAAVRERISAAAGRGRRDPAGITLVAVSKTFAVEEIRPAVEAGIADLGENRVQEADEKAPLLPADVRWHLVGHLQSNKINRALELFTLIHSVDRVSLGEALGARAASRGRPVRVLLQVNVAEKESQFGFPAADLPAGARALAGVAGLALDGLMCIAPEVDEPEQTRPFFRRLAGLFGDLAAELQRAGHPWSHLSMGMSGDYPIAVEEGATLVRVGRAIFGERTVPANAPGIAGASST